ncbi:MAG: tail fiber domain-containing protein [Casimicrobium sp.]
MNLSLNSFRRTSESPCELLKRRAAHVAALGLALAGTATHAQQSCPFDGGDASLAKEGLILSRYALGITGAPLVANTGIPAASAQTVEDSINSPAWSLNITGNTDVSGAPVLTSNDATIISRKIAGFSGAALTNGLALSGPRNTPTAVQNFLLAGCPGTAWVQGGNAFGMPGVIGTTDAQPLTVKSGGAAVSILNSSSAGLRILTLVDSSGFKSVNTIGGIHDNNVDSDVTGATIAGGGTFGGWDLLAYPNRVSGSYGAVGGGYTNVSGYLAVVTGGAENTASGYASAVNGGHNNTAAGNYSVAMGRRAKTLGNGSFQFADSSNVDFSSSTDNAFRVRATGGVRFVTDIDGTGATTWSCAAFAGAGWSCSSDRNLKQGLKKLDGKKVLAKLAAMPVYQWQPKGQNAHVKHVGPMAQDFMKAFGVGDDDKMIGMQDADGVALAAIQGLNQIVKAKDAKIAALEKANAVMQREMAAIKKRLGM